MAQSSPPTSLDHSHHHHHAATFVHRLPSRFRRSSHSESSSISSSATPPTPVEPPPTKDKMADIKSAKSYLASIIRDDWEYPARDPELVVPAHEPLSYHTREIGESDLESEHTRQRKKSIDPYRFENPDAIGTSISERKRKRCDLEKEEMQYNVGLRIWSQRRDAWTGAVAHKPMPPRLLPHTTDGAHSHGTAAAPGSEGLSSASAVDSSTLSPDSTNIDLFDEIGPYLPILPPLFPASHSLRARINPKSYPTIYAKVVTKSQTPNIPVPLSHMIGALVEGWKAEGEWPPRPSAVLSQDIKKGKISTKFSKWRREQEDLGGGAKGKVKRAMKAIWRREGSGHSCKEVEIVEENKDEGGLKEDLTLNKGLLEVEK